MRASCPVLVRAMHEAVRERRCAIRVVRRVERIAGQPAVAGHVEAAVPSVGQVDLEGDLRGDRAGDAAMLRRVGGGGDDPRGDRDDALALERRTTLAGFGRCRVGDRILREPTCSRWQMPARRPARPPHRRGREPSERAWKLLRRLKTRVLCTTFGRVAIARGQRVRGFSTQGCRRSQRAETGAARHHAGRTAWYHLSCACAALCDLCFSALRLSAISAYAAPAAR